MKFFIALGLFWVVIAIAMWRSTFLEAPNSTALVLAGLVGGFIVFWLVDRFIPDAPRRKPDGYVGRFRRLDGEVVHVARVNGGLMVISEEERGVMARDLGTVSGRDLLHWEKLASTPDGQERITRPG